ncbi:MAG: gas vesicle protein GvpN [Acidobacteriia bacterium]|nr:gas vesicle protein GvpN [Terriglobia bacterium]
MDSHDAGPVSEATVSVLAAEQHIVPEASDTFVLTPYIQDLTERALTYLEVGYAVHFAGPAGTGKTTLALHVAARLGRPAVLIHGDDEYESSDLVGKDCGYHKSKLVDNYIHSVVKTEESLSTLWEDHRLTTACLNGYTLVYDEFNRSRPEANNVLLSVLEGKILNLPNLRRSGEGYLRVHGDFRAILTSNPEEYAGVHKTQDALLDRLITISLGHFDRETEIQITVAKSKVPRSYAEAIVDIIRELRGFGVNNHRPTIRACIAIARILAHRNGRARINDPAFWALCHDVLHADTAKVTHDGQSLMKEKVDEAIRNVCGPPAKQRRKRQPGTEALEK